MFCFAMEFDRCLIKDYLLTYLLTYFRGPKPDTSLHCKDTDMRPVHHVVCHKNSLKYIFGDWLTGSNFRKRSV